MPLTCRQLGCAHPEAVSYLVIHEDDKLVVGGYCEEHLPTHKIDGYRLEKIPQADSVTDKPLITKPLEEKGQGVRQPGGDTPRTKGVLSMPTPSPMAPPDAVYGDANEDWEDPAAPVPAAPAAEQKAVPFTEAARREMDEHMSSNFRVHLGNEQVFDIQLTLRGGYTPAEFRSWFANLKESIGDAIRMGARSVIHQTPGMKAEVTAAPAPAPTSAPVAPAPVPVPPPTPPVSSGGGQEHVFVATKMEVQPGTKGTTRVAFYPPGAEKPMVSFSRQPKNLPSFFQNSGSGWNAQHFTVAGEYAVHYRITWKKSENLNQYGNPFTDIISIVPA